MLSFEILRKLTEYWQEEVLFFRRGTLNAVLEKDHRITFILAINLIKYGKVYLYSEAPNSLTEIVSVYSLTGDGFYYANPKLFPNSLENMFLSLMREGSNCFFLYEGDRVDWKAVHEAYGLLVRGHTAVFILPESLEAKELKVFDDVYRYAVFKDLYEFSGKYGKSLYRLGQDFLLYREEEGEVGSSDDISSD